MISRHAWRQIEGHSFAGRMPRAFMRELDSDGCAARADSRMRLVADEASLSPIGRKATAAVTKSANSVTSLALARGSGHSQQTFCRMVPLSRGTDRTSAMTGSLLHQESEGTPRLNPIRLFPNNSLACTFTRMVGRTRKLRPGGRGHGGPGLPLLRKWGVL